MSGVAGGGGHWALPWQGAPSLQPLPSRPALNRCPCLVLPPCSASPQADHALSSEPVTQTNFPPELFSSIRCFRHNDKKLTHATSLGECVGMLTLPLERAPPDSKLRSQPRAGLCCSLPGAHGARDTQLSRGPREARLPAPVRALTRYGRRTPGWGMQK